MGHLACPQEAIRTLCGLRQCPGHCTRISKSLWRKGGDLHCLSEHKILHHQVPSLTQCCSPHPWWQSLWLLSNKKAAMCHIWFTAVLAAAEAESGTGYTQYNAAKAWNFPGIPRCWLLPTHTQHEPPCPHCTHCSPSNHLVHSCPNCRYTVMV